MLPRSLSETDKCRPYSLKGTKTKMNSCSEAQINS